MSTKKNDEIVSVGFSERFSRVEMFMHNIYRYVLIKHFLSSFCLCYCEHETLFPAFALAQSFVSFGGDSFFASSFFPVSFPLLG